MVIRSSVPAARPLPWGHWPQRRRPRKDSRASLLCRWTPNTDFVRGRKSGRDGNRHSAGGGPFRAAVERGDETDVFHGLHVMAHRGMEDTALAIADGH